MHLVRPPLQQRRVAPKAEGLRASNDVSHEFR